jgi:hypothetical protein
LSVILLRWLRRQAPLRVAAGVDLDSLSTVQLEHCTSGLPKVAALPDKGFTL